MKLLTSMRIALSDAKATRRAKRERAMRQCRPHSLTTISIRRGEPGSAASPWSLAGEREVRAYWPRTSPFVPLPLFRGGR